LIDTAPFVYKVDFMAVIFKKVLNPIGSSGRLGVFVIQFQVVTIITKHPSIGAYPHIACTVVIANVAYAIVGESIIRVVMGYIVFD
jgi:hypothetical protein